MMYFWAIVAVAIIWGIRGIVRWWNLPAVVEARAKRVEARRKWRAEHGLFGWRRRKKQ